MNCYNLLYYTPKLWERAILFFAKLEQHEAAGTIIWYKQFANRMYIYGYIRVTSVDPGCEAGVDERYDNAGNN